jgi:hypothetical protein
MNNKYGGAGMIFVIILFILCCDYSQLFECIGMTLALFFSIFTGGGMNY